MSPGGLSDWRPNRLKKVSPMKKRPLIRSAIPQDHKKIIAVMKDWWDGRDLTPMLPKLFLVHFCDTSLAAEQDSKLVGFLVGFLSQSRNDEAYIHFAGVHPSYRNRGIAASLYRRFFQLCSGHGRLIIRACTSPVNKGSIKFHEHMGFGIEPGDGKVEGIPVTLDYNRPGDHKVLFKKVL